MKYIVWYLGSMLTFIFLDLLWLGKIAKNFYNSRLLDLKTPEINWYAAIVFYIVFIAGLLYFVVWPALMEGDYKSATWNGALLGLLTYATYDLTNLAVIRNWPLDVTVVDIIWGAVITSIVCTVSYFIGSKLL